MAPQQFATFYLGESLFGLPVSVIREINRILDITPVDRAPEFVRGLMNLRGQIVTVLDPGVRLGLEERGIVKSAKIIILKTASEAGADGLTRDSVGLFVDRIGDMVTAESGQIEPPPANVGGVDAANVEGIISLQNQLLVLLKLKELVANTQ